MKSPLLALSCFLFFSALAQKREELFNFSFKPAKFGAYYYVVTEKEDSLWNRKAYFLSQKTVAMQGRYKDEECKIGHGLFTWYHPTRSMKSQGRYVDGKKEGVWLAWNEKGTMLTDSSSYKDGRRLGISLRWHDNGMIRDSMNFDGTGNGVQVSWYDDGALASAGLWTQDTLKKGRWKNYHKNGQLMATEDYENGKKIAGACYDETGTQLDSVACDEKEAEPSGGKEGWRRYLERHLLSLIQAKAKVLPPGQYTVPVRFVVEKDGSLSEFTAFTEYGQGLEEELIKILKGSPRWTPGRQHGRLVKSYHTQPITFTIQSQ